MIPAITRRVVDMFKALLTLGPFPVGLGPLPVGFPVPLPLPVGLPDGFPVGLPEGTVGIVGMPAEILDTAFTVPITYTRTYQWEREAWAGRDR